MLRSITSIVADGMLFLLPNELIHHMILPYAWDSHVDVEVKQTFRTQATHELLHKVWDEKQVISIHEFPSHQCIFVSYYGMSSKARKFPKPYHSHIVVRNSLADHLRVRKQFIDDDGDGLRVWMTQNDGHCMSVHERD